MPNRKTILIIFAVLVLILFLFWIFKDKEAENGGNYVKFPFGGNENIEAPEPRQEFRGSILTPIIKETFIKAGEKFEEYLPIEDLKEEFVKMEEKIKNEEKTVSELSDEEYFDLFYPENYISYLNVMQDKMVEDGYMGNKEVVVFETEKDVYPVLYKITNYVAEKEYITEEEKINLRNGIEELKELNKIERPFIVEQLLSFLISKVHAQEVSIGLMCYRSGVGGPVGFNGWAWCCNCGLFCSYGCTYMPDCGPGGVNCNVPYGCLNAVCRFGAAIWDPTTGICGCG